MIKQNIENDLKVAMLSGDKKKASVLKMLKSAILYVEVAEGSRESGLSDEKLEVILRKESKKRADAALIYQQANEQVRSENEIYEQQIIDGYLPELLSEGELRSLVETVTHELGANKMSDMGLVMSALKEKIKGRADGATVSSLVKEVLNKEVK